MEKNILSQFINNIPHFIWWKDLEGKFLGCNDNMLRKMGLNDQKELIGKTDHDFWDKEEADFFRKIDVEIISSGKPQLNFEESITLPEEGKRWLSTSKMPLRDNEKNIVGTIGWFDDITIRKQLETDVLKAKEDNYQMLFDSMTEMVTILELIYDVEGKPIDYYIRDINLAAASFYGKTKSQLIDKKITSIVNTIEEYWLNTFAKADKSGKSTTFEYYGSEYDKYYSGSVWKIAENILGVTYKDITEIKQIQESKAIANEKFERIEIELNEAQKLAKVGSWLWSPSEQKGEWSDEMYQIWGIAVNEPIMSYETAISKVHKDDIGLFHNAHKNAELKGEPYDIEYRILFPEMPPKTIRSICKPVLGDDGKIIKLTGTNQDVSVQKRLEEVQAKHQRSKAIAEMSASIAHDFNNALQEMMGNLEIVRLETNLTDSTKERLNNIVSTIGDISGRVSALQNFGNTELDIADTTFINFNVLLNECLQQSRPLWKDSMEKKGCHIDVKTNFQDVPNIKCIRGELKSAVHNIIKNSIEAMPTGGEFNITTGLKEGSVFARFTDTGIGMSEETRLKIFQPFYTTKGLELGRGLGMSGAYSTITKYAGDLSILFTELDKGTTIEIVFPVSEQNEPLTYIPPALDKELVLNVLWVDDDVLITEAVCELVRSFGHKCQVVNSGQDAVEFLSNNPCDIVFTDIGMPGMTGWELADSIRENYGTNIKIIVVSGWDISEEDREKHNIDDILQKPFLYEDLEKKLQLLYA